jgi:hypothetical protein
VAKQKITDEMRELAETEIRAKQQEIRYDIRDFTVGYLVEQFEEDLFFIPPYQREFIWSKDNQCKFIESVILGFPIPMLFVADLADGTLEVVDGAQRVSTLEAFVAGDLVLSGLEILPSLNGFTFLDLSIPQKRKIETRPLRIVIMEDVTSEEIRQELFHRINTRSVKAKGSEIRRGSFPGVFVELIKELAVDPLFRKLCPISTSTAKRREDEELVTRFVAYSDSYRDFRHDVDNFLDKFVHEHRDNIDVDRVRAEFHRTMQFVQRNFPYGFAKTTKAKSTPRVRFEAIAVGVNLALREQPDLIPMHGVREWLDSPEFSTHVTTHASNSGPRLRGRVEFVKNHLLMP